MSGSISTVAIHADRDVHPSRAVAPPIFQTATFWAEDAEQFVQAAVDRRGQGFYTRFGNPNHAQVAAVVAELEHTEAAMVTASGMAALTTAVLALVSAGDHVIGQKSTYGGTASVLLNLLPRLGVSTTQVDQADPEAFENALTPQTRLILAESPSNPLLQITDLRAVADLASRVTEYAGVGQARSSMALVIWDSSPSSLSSSTPLASARASSWSASSGSTTGRQASAGVVPVRSAA
jgi:methionine-gamma-lyase